MDAAFGDAHMRANVVERFTRRGIERGSHRPAAALQLPRLSRGLPRCRHRARSVAAQRRPDDARRVVDGGSGGDADGEPCARPDVGQRADVPAAWPSLIAADSQAYIETVIALARMPEQLAEWRHGLSPPY